jgi:hypothetical protein
LEVEIEQSTLAIPNRAVRFARYDSPRPLGQRRTVPTPK